MIVVDPCRSAGPRWLGIQACQLISDQSVGELLDFAQGLKLPMAWFQPRGPVPQFELSPHWRRKAIAAGARAVDRVGFAEATERWRLRNAR